MVEAEQLEPEESVQGGVALEVFSATMSKERLKFLVHDIGQSLHKGRRWRFDRFAALRRGMPHQCGNMVQIGDYGAVDECLHTCRNQIGFRCFNPNKPAKYGINFKCLNVIALKSLLASLWSWVTHHYIPSTQDITLRLIEKVDWHNEDEQERTAY